MNEGTAEDLFKQVLTKEELSEVAVVLPYRKFFPNNPQADVRINFNGWKDHSDSLIDNTIIPFQCPEGLKAIPETSLTLENGKTLTTYFVHDPERIEVVKLEPSAELTLQKQMTQHSDRGFTFIAKVKGDAYMWKKRPFAVTDVPDDVLSNPSLSSLIPQEFRLPAKKR